MDNHTAPNIINDITDETGTVVLSKSMAPKQVTVHNQEIVAINHRIITYPNQTIPLQANDITNNQGNRFIPIHYLMPPIIINVRNDADNGAKTTLNQTQLNYFKQRGNNALIFIHGFNVPFGSYAKQIANIHATPDLMLNGSAATMTSAPRTLYRDFNMLEKHFGPIQSHDDDKSHQFRNDLWLNGTGAHNWFIHMEDNLNRATKQFNRCNYLHFTRLINVAWSGDVFELEYLKAEEPANQAGLALIPLIKQLQQAGLEINILAHSLGCRVLLKLMDALGKRKMDNILNHAFLWEAAVPMSALSNRVSDDRSIKQNSHFIHAHKAAKKITVLYSKHDWVLGLTYMVANKLGIVPTLSPDRWQLRGSYLRKRDKKAFEDYIMQSEHLFSTTNALQLLSVGSNANQTSEHAEQLRMMFERMQQRVERKYQVQSALGYGGPDHYTRRLLGDKLIAIQQEELNGHSAMKIPSETLMRNIYEQYIIGGRYGLRKFGNYQLM